MTLPRNSFEYQPQYRTRCRRGSGIFMINLAASDHIFGDGLASGDPSAWSATMP